MPTEERQQPNYSKVKTIEECEGRIVDTQKTISRKYKLRVQAEQAKRDTTASYNEQIKHLKEELDHELGVLSGWEDRRRLIAAGGANVQDVEEDNADAQIPVIPLPQPPAPPPVMVSPPPAPPAPSVLSATIPMPPPPSYPAPVSVPPPPPAASQGNGQKLVPFPLPTKRIAS